MHGQLQWLMTTGGTLPVSQTERVTVATGTGSKTATKKAPAKSAGQTQKDTDKMATATSTSTPEFKVVSNPPKFRRGQGRAKSDLRTKIEDLKTGEWLLVGEADEKRKNSVRSMTASVRSAERANGVEEVQFSVREDEDNNLWVGRIKG